MQLLITFLAPFRNTTSNTRQSGDGGRRLGALRQLLPILYRHQVKRDGAAVQC